MRQNELIRNLILSTTAGPLTCCIVPHLVYVMALDAPLLHIVLPAAACTTCSFVAVARRPSPFLIPAAAVTQALGLSPSLPRPPSTNPYYPFDAPVFRPSSSPLSSSGRPRHHSHLPLALLPSPRSAPQARARPLASSHLSSSPSPPLSSPSPVPRPPGRIVQPA